MNAKQERAAFEAWSENNGWQLHKVTPCDGSEPYYLDGAERSSWAAWQARAAIELDRHGRGEPVAWLTSDGKMLVFADRVEDGFESGMTPLYVGPQPAEPVKEVSDEEWLKQHEALMHRVSKAAIVIGYGGTINGATAEASLENAEKLLMDHARKRVQPASTDTAYQAGFDAAIKAVKARIEALENKEVK